MRIKKIQITGIGSLLALLLVVSSCASSGARFYQGQPLPPGEVAIFFLHRHCSLDEFMGKGILPPSNVFEVLPGRYSLCVRYHSSGDYSTSKSRSCVTITLDAQPAHVYYVYPQFPKPGLWQPALADFLRDQDFEKFDEGIMGYLDSGNDIKARAAKYFKSERRVITLTNRGLWE